MMYNNLYLVNFYEFINIHKSLHRPKLGMNSGQEEIKWQEVLDSQKYLNS